MMESSVWREALSWIIFAVGEGVGGVLFGFCGQGWGGSIYTASVEEMLSLGNNRLCLGWGCEWVCWD